MFGYATDLRSRTQGRATYTMQFDSYQQMPANVQEEIVAVSAASEAPQTPFTRQSYTRSDEFAEKESASMARRSSSGTSPM